MFERVAKLFLKVPAGLSLLGAFLLPLLMVIAGASTADAAISSAKVTTTHWKNGSTEGYSITLIAAVPESAGIPTVVVSGNGISPTTLVPNNDGMQVATVAVATRPSLTSTYNFLVKFEDGSSETIIAPITAVLGTVPTPNAFPTPTAPIGVLGNTANPTFSWLPPASTPEGGYLVSLQGEDITWSEELAPEQTSTQYSSPGGGMPATPTPGVVYEWSVAALDANGNAAEYRSSFVMGINFTGKVTNLSGVGIAGAEVRVFNTNGVQMPTVAVTSLDGTYRYGGLSAGNYTVSFSSGSYLVYYSNWLFPPSDPVTVVSNVVTTGIDAVIGDYGVIPGQVAVPRGTNVTAIQAGLYTPAQVAVSSVPVLTVPLTSGFATFHLSPVPAGSYLVKLSGAGLLDVWKPVTVTAGFHTATVSATLSSGIPTVNTFEAPATSATLAVSGITVAASSFGNTIAGYLLTETSATPSATAAGWQSNPPTSYTFTSGGTKTLYAWAKGSSTGLVSASRSATIVVGPEITLSTLANQSVTSKQVLNVAGTASSAGSTISTVRVNGVAAIVNADGSFSYPVPLSAGSNVVTVAATNAHGATTTVARSITLSSSVPTLTVTAPADNAATTSGLLTVAGDAAAGSTVEVLVNGTSEASLSGAGFSTTVSLPLGMNTVEVVATDASGNTNSTKRTVTRLGSGPDLQITTPAEDTSVSSTTPVATTISGTTSGATVTISAGGTIYTPAVVSGSFSSEVTVAVGINAVVVTAQDSSGTTTSVQRNIVVSGKAGDCNGDGSVAINELQAAINMFLGTQAVSACVDVTGDGAVEIHELQKTINSFLSL